MKVVLSQYAGACYGVQRALDMAFHLIDTATPAVTFGPIIHNPQVVKELEEKGVRAVSDLSEVRAHEAVIVRSHGVTPQVRAEIEQHGFELVDATCPFVARAQSSAAGLAQGGKTVIVLGEEGHPEVQGMTAYILQAGGTPLVLGNAQELPSVLPDEVGLVSQTTQIQANYEALLCALREKGVRVSEKCTICTATEQRQAAAAQLSSLVDAMIIIGGRNSSNTTRLYEICKTICPASYHIEAASEIDPRWFDGVHTVGVTAGASTPERHIQELVALLEQL